MARENRWVQHIFLVLAILSLVIVSNPVFGQTNSRPFNWLELCRSPAVDAVVAEPCENLTTPDGNTLTKEGQRVMGSFLGAGLLLAADPTGKTLGNQFGTKRTFMWRYSEMDIIKK